MEVSYETLQDLKNGTQAIHMLNTITPTERRDLRENAGITVSSLAAMLGIPWRQLLAYEKGAVANGEHAAKYYYALAAMQPAEPELTVEERSRLQQYFDADQTCRHCSGIHTRACPRVKRLAWHPDSTLAEVEFWADGQWPTENVVFRDSPQLTEVSDA